MPITNLQLSVPRTFRWDPATGPYTIDIQGPGVASKTSIPGAMVSVPLASLAQGITYTFIVSDSATPANTGSMEFHLNVAGNALVAGPAPAPANPPPPPNPGAGGGAPPANPPGGGQGGNPPPPANPPPNPAPAPVPTPGAGGGAPPATGGNQGTGVNVAGGNGQPITIHIQQTAPPPIAAPASPATPAPATDDKTITIIGYIAMVALGLGLVGLLGWFYTRGSKDKTSEPMVSTQEMKYQLWYLTNVHKVDLENLRRDLMPQPPAVDITTTNGYHVVAQVMPTILIAGNVTSTNGNVGVVNIGGSTSSSVRSTEVVETSVISPERKVTKLVTSTIVTTNTLTNTVYLEVSTPGPVEYITNNPPALSFAPPAPPASVSPSVALFAPPPEILCFWCSRPNCYSMTFGCNMGCSWEYSYRPLVPYRFGPSHRGDPFLRR